MLLTKTSELAILSLLVLAQKPAGYLINPGELARCLDESETYIGKVLRLLAQGGLVRSRRGKSGGFELLREAREVSLLDIVEMCQGTIAGNYCGRLSVCTIKETCGYHQAMHDLRESTRTALGRWTLARILAAPKPRGAVQGCMMRKVRGVGAGKPI
jgi:Rrf2 family protein